MLGARAQKDALDEFGVGLEKLISKRSAERIRIKAAMFIAGKLHIFIL